MDGYSDKARAAVALRMTCAKAAGKDHSFGAPRVWCVDHVGDADLTMPAGVSVEGVAEAVAAFVMEAGRLPDLVDIGGLATFRVQPARRGRLGGRVAMVTGGAQGFGWGIADAMLAEGCDMVVADVNAALGHEVVKAFERRYGIGSAMFAAVDVADAGSLRVAVEAAACTFGGLDILVANAGILRAGGIEDIDEETFDAVTRINYKGYFLTVRAVVPLMKQQHRLFADWPMDIVQVNSKSGLEGSRRNFAYAGGKFGGIGLTQSFALELVSDNIKVNAVCPGNYFDGPLWSDPETGLFVQYLKAGKVPGAKTVEDVRDHYLAQIPMGRGCTPYDVAVAIFYLHEQAYETGQALPVTGGQRMLK